MKPALYKRIQEVKYAAHVAFPMFDPLNAHVLNAENIDFVCCTNVSPHLPAAGVNTSVNLDIATKYFNFIFEVG
jgi:hypothetical protein